MNSHSDDDRRSGPRECSEISSFNSLIDLLLSVPNRDIRARLTQDADAQPSKVEPFEAERRSE